MTLTLKQLGETTGVIIYEGPSLIDNAPIVMIATLSSANVKTGNMIQTWILRTDINPVEAIATNQDDSICGDCKHRGIGNGKMRSCYVNVGQAPLNIFRKYHNGGYLKTDSALPFRKRFVRLGAYGDPAAVPIDILKHIVNGASGWTGYTHQWKECDPEYRDVVMASVDNESEFHQARAKGYRTFRVRDEDDDLMKGEFVCPASPEGGDRLKCIDCTACNGTKLGRVKNGNVAIIVHGSRAKLGGWKVNKEKS